VTADPAPARGSASSPVLEWTEDPPNPICLAPPPCILAACLLWPWGPRVTAHRAGGGRLLPRSGAPRPPCPWCRGFPPRTSLAPGAAVQREVGMTAARAVVAACWSGNAAAWAFTLLGWRSRSLAEAQWVSPCSPSMHSPSGGSFCCSAFSSSINFVLCLLSLPTERRRKGPSRTGTWRRRR